MNTCFLLIWKDSGVKRFLHPYATKLLYVFWLMLIFMIVSVRSNVACGHTCRDYLKVRNMLLKHAVINELGCTCGEVESHSTG